MPETEWLLSNDVEWCRRLFQSIAPGGIWGVPRSGLTFRKDGDTLVLHDRMPWQAEMGGSTKGWRKWQDEDFEAIREHFAAAGIEVRSE